MSPPAPDSEPEAAPAGPPPLPAIAPASPDTLAILAELRKPAGTGSRWGNLVLLVVSLFLFVSLGFFNWSWDQIALLVLALLLHESGHYLAMRFFHYQDVKMFFIPFFGAAVSGRAQDAPAYQRVLVSLMGPAPGVAIGLGLALANFAVPHPLLHRAALLLLLLNGLNLLPLMPFDGGRVLNEVIFARHRWAEAGFKIVAGLLLIVWGFADHSTVLSVVGFLTLFSTTAVLKLGAIAQWLRCQREAIPAVQPEELSADQCAAVAQVVRGEFGAALKPPQVAGIIRNAMERAKLEPPAALTSVCLLVVYLGTFLAALIGIVILVAQHVKANPLQ